MFEQIDRFMFISCSLYTWWDSLFNDCTPECAEEFGGTGTPFMGSILKLVEPSVN